jgi:hypothetical protein
MRQAFCGSVGLSQTELARIKFIEDNHKESVASLESRLQQSRDELEQALAANTDLKKEALELSKAREDADNTAFIR